MLIVTLAFPQPTGVIVVFPIVNDCPSIDTTLLDEFRDLMLRIVVVFGIMTG